MQGRKTRTTVIIARTLGRLRVRERREFSERRLFFSERILREAFRVTLAVTMVDSLLRATNRDFHKNSTFA